MPISVHAPVNKKVAIDGISWTPITSARICARATLLNTNSFAILCATNASDVDTQMLVNGYTICQMPAPIHSDQVRFPAGDILLYVRAASPSDVGSVMCTFEE